MEGINNLNDYATKFDVPFMVADVETGHVAMSNDVRDLKPWIHEATKFDIKVLWVAGNDKNCVTYLQKYVDKCIQANIKRNFKF